MTTRTADPLAARAAEQDARNASLLAATEYADARVESAVLPLTLDLSSGTLTAETETAIAALEKEAARTAIEALASLAKVNDIDHLGGGLELIPALLMTLAATDYQRSHYTIEHGHTSIGYYSALASLGFLDRDRVINTFRRGLDIAGHVSWVPGGTELSSGRLGVMFPVGTGLALGLKAHHGRAAHVICHTGDAGWISGQALNGLNAAAVHRAPITFVMHRNGIQLSGTTRHIMNQDPRRIIAGFGIKILEIRSLHDRRELFGAYCEAFRNAQNGEPTLIYPTGWGYASDDGPATVEAFGQRYGMYLRQGASPGAAIQMFRMNAEIDVRHVLSAIHVPTLILHRTDDSFVPVGGSRELATQIPHARYIELPGRDHLFYVGDYDAILDAIEELLLLTYP